MIDSDIVELQVKVRIKVDTPTSSNPSGFYQEKLLLNFSTEIENSLIRYSFNKEMNQSIPFDPDNPPLIECVNGVMTNYSVFVQGFKGDPNPESEQICCNSSEVVEFFYVILPTLSPLFTIPDQKKYSGIAVISLYSAVDNSNIFYSLDNSSFEKYQKSIKIENNQLNSIQISIFFYAEKTGYFTTNIYQYSFQIDSIPKIENLNEKNGKEKMKKFYIIIGLISFILIIINGFILNLIKFLKEIKK
ncbi:hypothetical protein M0811_11623 [Anaeramoeba ignava]|uniref:Transmembrane protein n=1 Tax=Anaeramoeba ignava TaxID=1746090 RepID=A0A9Q0LCM3_ANAIG|nr:hypothetical protein M0811_11623 [Anaeramoeba ignava]